MIDFLCFLIVAAGIAIPHLLMALVAPDRELRPDVGATITKALRAIDMSQKEAALIAGMDFAQWSRGVNGLGPLDLHKLARLPWRFQGLWIQYYVKACLVAWLAECRADQQEFSA